MVDQEFSYQVTVDRVIDGDTVDVIVDYGFNLFQKQRIRLLGVNTPERGKKNFKVATEILKELLNDASRRDERGRLRLVSFKTGKYGRWLGLITSLDKVIDVTSAMEEQWPNE